MVNLLNEGRSFNPSLARAAEEFERGFAADLIPQKMGGRSCGVEAPRSLRGAKLWVSGSDEDLRRSRAEEHRWRDVEAAVKSSIIKSGIEQLSSPAPLPPPPDAAQSLSDRPAPRDLDAAVPAPNPAKPADRVQTFAQTPSG